MSPTASETVPNRALSSAETRTLIERDFTRMLDGYSILSSPAAFGRVSWRISLVLTMAAGQEFPIDIVSQPQATNQVKENPTLAAVTSYPMPPAIDQSEVQKTLTRELTRNVTSPNRERLREGLPVPVDIRQTDGTTRTEQIAYNPDPNMEQDVTVAESEGQ